MSFFKSIAKIVVKTAISGSFSLSTVGPIAVAGIVPLAIYGFIKKRRSRNKDDEDDEDDEELRRQLREATRDDVQISLEYVSESEELF